MFSISILADIRKYLSGNDDGMVQREDRRSVGDDESGDKGVEGAVRGFDNIETSPKQWRRVSGGSSEITGKYEVIVPGLNTQIRDTEGNIESDELETQQLRVNDTSSVCGQRVARNIKLFHSLDSTTSEENSTPCTDRKTEQRDLNRENNQELLDVTLSKFSSRSKLEAQNDSEEPSITSPAILPQSQVVNSNTNDCYRRGGFLSLFGTLDEFDAGTLIDTQAPGNVPSGDKHCKQVSQSSGSQFNPKERCFLNTSAAAATAISPDKENTFHTRLDPEDNNERIIKCKEKLVSPVFSQEMTKPSKDVTNSLSSVDSLDTTKDVENKLSVRSVGNVILNTITELFSQFLSKSSSSRTSSLKRLSDNRENDLQETPEVTVRLRKKPSIQHGVKNKDGTDDYSIHSEMGKRIAWIADEQQDAEGIISSNREDNGKIQINEEGAARDDNDDNVAREELAQGTNRVKHIVNIIESSMKGNTAMERLKDEKLKRLEDEALQNTRQPLASEWEDGEQRQENGLIKVEEISKEEKGRPDTNTPFPQSETSKMKENEDQTCIKKSDKAVESRLFTAQNTSGMERQEGSEEEKEDKEIKMMVEEEDESESDTDEESEAENSEVVKRPNSKCPTVSFYRYSTLGPRELQGRNSVHGFSMVRPRTVIIGLGVCTETKYIDDSFGDGVSETESEDDQEISPAPVSAPAPTPTRQRPTTPSRTSRPHSPLSDMDTESKRNSQAVSTEPSDLEDHSSVTTSDLESHEPPVVDSRKDKAYRIALELLHTERTYVKVLHLIDQEFQFRVDNENRAHHMFPHDVILHMFSNIKSIYKLHHDFLLPQLEERMARWEHNRSIGDIMKNFAPFLKMYTEYVRNFDNAMTLINQWQAKCQRFAAIMDDIHSMEVCGNLTLQHHMLSPVQRIPRYEMLLRDYFKKLPEDSPDCHDTEKALHLVSTAANHANDAMKKIDKFEKLLEIQESLGGAEDLVSPTRELIKEGKIIKISARSGDHQERYIFLLTDLLMLCSPRLMSGRVMSGPQYRLRAKYHVENLIIREGDNLETANTFYIKDNNKSVELYTQTIEEKEQWLDAFIRAIHETSQRKSSLKLHFNPNQRIMDVDLGQKQPMLIRSDSVTKCMECGSQFTMVRRKHHCRACGAVVCSKCSSFKASLAYECGKSVRVCQTCHATLQELSSSTATPSPEIDEGDECSVYSAKDHLDLPFRSRGVLEVSAKTSGAVMQGFLQLKTHRKTWVKRWFALHTDFVLYSFKCEADDQALTATPVPGFTVTHLQGTRNESGISDKEKEKAFKLHHAKKQYIFQAASKDESQRWMAALKKASQAELPSPVQ